MDADNKYPGYGGTGARRHKGKQKRKFPRMGYESFANDEDDDNYNESVNNSEVVVVPRMNIDKMNGRTGMVVEHRNSMYEGGDIINTDCDIDLNVNTPVKQSSKVETNGSDALATYEV